MCLNGLAMLAGIANQFSQKHIDLNDIKTRFNILPPGTLTARFSPRDICI